MLNFVVVNGSGNVSTLREELFAGVSFGLDKIENVFLTFTFQWNICKSNISSDVGVFLDAIDLHLVHLFLDLISNLWDQLSSESKTLSFDVLKT